MPATNSLHEASRLMTICNSCRYCEGLCAVFPAMEMRRVFGEGDLNLLANLCHSCGACYDDCQFTPPHEFAVNVPVTLARLRTESWEKYTRPRALGRLFRYNGAAIAFAVAASVSVLLAGFVLWGDARALFRAHSGPGAFYQLMPHYLMASLFGGAFLYALLAMSMGVRAFWRDVNEGMPLELDAASLWQAIKDAATLRYLDGGGVGCFNGNDRPQDTRRLFHHLTFYGFLLCLAATSVATMYHYLLHCEAPYRWYDFPVLLGTAGGTGLVIGPTGLMLARRRRRKELKAGSPSGLDSAFTLLLLLTSLSGIALLLLRHTAAIGVLLFLHLGLVFALFVTLPYSRFVHGVYRYVALVRHAGERR